MVVSMKKRVYRFFMKLLQIHQDRQRDKSALKVINCKRRNFPARLGYADWKTYNALVPNCTKRENARWSKLYTN